MIRTPPRLISVTPGRLVWFGLGVRWLRCSPASNKLCVLQWTVWMDPVSYVLSVNDSERDRQKSLLPPTACMEGSSQQNQSVFPK